MSAIRLCDITVAYNGNPVLADFSLCLPKQGVFAITGPSGSGKTTLLRVLAGLTPIASGHMEGLDNQRISMVFQEDRLIPWLTAISNVSLPLSRKQADREAIARQWIENMELHEYAQHYPAELSGGMQRRVALARACAYAGDILLLDEPFTGLDGDLRSRVAAHVATAAPLIVLVSHDQEEARLLGASVIPLKMP